MQTLKIASEKARYEAVAGLTLGRDLQILSSPHAVSAVPKGQTVRFVPFYISFSFNLFNLSGNQAAMFPSIYLYHLLLLR
jgi:hypothetical protein